jgi:hypothetical protein
VLSSVHGRREDIIDWHSNVDYPFRILTVTTSLYRLEREDFSLNTGRCYLVQIGDQQELNWIFIYQH